MRLSVRRSSPTNVVSPEASSDVGPYLAYLENELT